MRGSSVSFKSELRNIWLKHESIPDNIDTLSVTEKDKFPREYDYIHINDFFHESIEYSQIYFNSNSLQLLEDQLIKRILPGYFNRSKVLFNTYKKLVNYFDPVDQARFMIMGSAVLYSHGLRNCNDIDGYVLTSKTYKTKDFDKVIDRYFKSKDKLHFYDITMKGTEEYEEWWGDFLNKMATGCGGQTFDNLVLNPKFYYHFMGIKIIHMDCDYQKRLLRNRPASTTDLIVINKLLRKKYKIPQIPDKTWEGKEVNRNKFLSTIKFYLDKRYKINLSVHDIIQIINKSHQ
jgi:hypothetical protein